MKNAKVTRVREQDINFVDNFRGKFTRTNAFSFMTQSMPKIIDIKEIKRKKKKNKVGIYYYQEFEL